MLELDDGTCLTESLAICHYLEQVHPEPNLIGVDAKEQALVLMWTDIQIFEGYLGISGGPAQRARGFQGPRRSAAPCRTRRFPRSRSAASGAPRCSSTGSRRGSGRARSSRRRRFTYADIAGYVYLGFAVRSLGGATPLEGRPSIKRWSETIAARPAIQAPA